MDMLNHMVDALLQYRSTLIRRKVFQNIKIDLYASNVKPKYNEIM